MDLELRSVGSLRDSAAGDSAGSVATLFDIDVATPTVVAAVSVNTSNGGKMVDPSSLVFNDISTLHMSQSSQMSDAASAKPTPAETRAEPVSDEYKSIESEDIAELSQLEDEIMDR